MALRNHSADAECPCQPARDGKRAREVTAETTKDTKYHEDPRWYSFVILSVLRGEELADYLPQRGIDLPVSNHALHRKLGLSCFR